MNMSEVHRLTKKFFADDEAERARLVERLESAKNNLPPAFRITRLVDRKERWTAKSWHSQMQELAFVGSSRSRIRRRKLCRRSSRR
jgi:hypothetical protein